MIKNFSQLHVKIEDKDFYLNAEYSSTFPQVKEALFQFQKNVGAIEDQLKAQQEKLEADKKALETLENTVDTNQPPEVVD